MLLLLCTPLIAHTAPSWIFLLDLLPSPPSWIFLLDLLPSPPSWLFLPSLSWLLAASLYACVGLVILQSRALQGMGFTYGFPASWLQSLALRLILCASNLCFLSLLYGSYLGVTFLPFDSQRGGGCCCTNFVTHSRLPHSILHSRLNHPPLGFSVSPNHHNPATASSFPHLRPNCSSLTISEFTQWIFSDSPPNPNLGHSVGHSQINLDSHQPL